MLINQIPNEYIYSLGAFLFIIPNIFIFYFRPDLRKYMLLMSFILLPFAPLTEYFFFKDYWYPPDIIDFEIFGMRVILGDIILTATVPPIMALFYLYIFDLRFDCDSTYKDLKTLGLKILAIQSLLMLVFVALIYFTDINSIFAYTFASTIMAGLMMLRRRDFLKVYFITVILMGINVFLFYLAYQFVVGDDYLKAVWLLDHDKYAINFLGINIPSTEVIFGAFVSPFYMFLIPFLTNKKIIKRSTKLI